MDRFDRIYQLHHLLDGLHVPRPLNRLAEDMECSERTVKRTIRHLREALRLFAIERIEILGPAKTAFRHLTTKALDHAFDDSYGIFSGAPTQTAVLAFSAERARWIAQEQWHPEQQGHWREDGRYEMRIPYSNPTELILDILRYGPDVEVLEPENLRESVVRRLTEAVAIYRSGRDTK